MANSWTEESLFNEMSISRCLNNMEHTSIQSHILCIYGMKVIGKSPPLSMLTPPRIPLPMNVLWFCGSAAARPDDDMWYTTACGIWMDMDDWYTPSSSSSSRSPPQSNNLFISHWNLLLCSDQPSSSLLIFSMPGIGLFSSSLPPHRNLCRLFIQHV